MQGISLKRRYNIWGEKMCLEVRGEETGGWDGIKGWWGTWEQQLQKGVMCISRRELMDPHCRIRGCLALPSHPCNVAEVLSLQPARESSNKSSNIPDVMGLVSWSLCKLMDYRSLNTECRGMNISTNRKVGARRKLQKR